MNMDGFNALPNPLDFKVTNQPTASLPSPTHTPFTRTSDCLHQFYGVCVDTCPVGKTILCNEEPLSADAAAMTEDEKVNCFVPNSFGFKSRSSKCVSGGDPVLLCLVVGRYFYILTFLPLHLSFPLQVDLRSKCWLIPLNMTRYV